MAVETEAKLRVSSHEPIRERLRELGAERLGEVVENNRIYDRFDGSLRKSGCGLRIRSTTAEDGGAESATLTFKGPTQPGPLKSREELEVDLSDADTGGRLLEALGYTAILCFQKRRESFALGGCRVELDEPPHIGLFVEIEGPSEAAIRSVQADLGLADLEHTKASYVHMLARYCEEHGVTNRVLPLPDTTESKEATI